MGDENLVVDQRLLEAIETYRNRVADAKRMLRVEVDLYAARVRQMTGGTAQGLHCADLASD